jgi:hypothetical protein
MFNLSLFLILSLIFPLTEAADIAAKPLACQS